MQTRSAIRDWRLAILLGWHVCRKKLARTIFSKRKFSHEKCFEIFPEFFEPLFCGSGKIPQKSRHISLPPNFPPKHRKKITDELLQERRAIGDFAHRSIVVIPSLISFTPVGAGAGGEGPDGSYPEGMRFEKVLTLETGEEVDMLVSVVETPDHEFQSSS